VPPIKALLACCAVFATSILVSVNANAAEGDLDPGFDLDGKVVTDFQFFLNGLLYSNYQEARSVALAADGGIVVGGYNLSHTQQNSNFLVAKYDSVGALADFGGFGKDVTDFAGDNDSANDVVIQSDGKIIAAGSAEMGPTGSDFALVRYMAVGGPDPTFGTQVQPDIGEVTTNIDATTPGDDVAVAVALQSDGKIVVAGYGKIGGLGISDFVVVRYLPSGALDPNFGINGITVTNLGSDDRANGMVIQDDGKIVVVGVSNGDLALVRYLSNGALDPDFGSNGKVLTDVSSQSADAEDVILQDDGKIVVVGGVGGTIDKGVVARYDATGVLDATFDGESNGNGLITIDVNAGTEYLTEVAIQDDGGIVVGGVADMGADEQFAVVRLMVDGSRDVTFAGGQALTNFGPSIDRAYGLALLADGDIVQVGSTSATRPPSNDTDLALARYVGDSTSPSLVVVRSGSGAMGVGQSETVTFSLSEATRDFELSDIVVTDGTLSGFTGSGTQYSGTVTPVAESAGTMTVAVEAGRFVDKAGNPNLAATTLVIDFDTRSSAGGADTLPATPGTGSGGTLPGGASTPGSVSSGTSRVAPKLRVKRSVTVRAVAIYAGHSLSAGDKITVKVQKSSQRVCTVMGPKRLRGAKVGRCKVVVKVRSADGRVSSRRVTVPVVRR
jgi:uncharacterized delta-60 repeat protein